ncbi:TPA: hypothetical protein DDZ10_03695 [Candidatus Uhrbacteria bacterium]|uniref:PilT protein domain protein n=1 Tax=Candidatus Uhrbacteria bacterium GW2011_GWC2_53_7 TaxID=1618986 RepID=A0A0G2A1U7_9BACT|nr:MAG: PilT protein domain protein [Candidatus Uhrbacteria bacterium GW2011_GWC2_53_7]OGL72422.1 MAG: hypothetical protein A3D69_02430 [Candidatus Uhrbacteria bacterium RIFCSPHIGHO2_02_FULL_54_11]HBL39745.1 hypothetical protein [Candidatus Uhrbacteria bacterium]
MNANKYFIDTNIFLRVIAKDDEKKTRDCEVVIEALTNGHITGVTSTLVLAEFAWTCLSFYKLKKTAFTPAINALLGIKRLAILDDYNHVLALKLYETHSVKFIDALITSHATVIKEHLPILSYDRDFDKLNVRRVEPGELDL